MSQHQATKIVATEVCRRECEDFPTMEAAITSLTGRGFEKASTRDHHYRHPTQMADGYWQRADVWRLSGLGYDGARIGYWPAIA